MGARNLSSATPGATLPLPEYVVPAGGRRLRLQRLPPGNLRLLFEAEGRSGPHVVYASVELGRTTALETLGALGRLCDLVAERGLPGE